MFEAYASRMELTRSREALRLAEKSFADLAATNTAETFRDQFIETITMIRNVGSMISNETKGHRSPAFGEWWKDTAEDALYKFVTEVRNDAFKYGARRNNVRHAVTLHDVVGVSGEGVQETETSRSEHSFEVFFSGGTHDGDPVLPLLRRYLDWLRDVVLPRAESLIP
jgi:hypothetical protein